MKKALVSLLAALGLVPARRHAVLSRRVAELTDDLREWRKRAKKSKARVRDLRAHIQRQAESLAESRALTEQRHDQELAAMQARLVETERALALARDHLMAIEVKLDILEGAANVLDARTRVAQRQPSETGATIG